MTREEAIDILQNGAKYEDDEDFDEKLYEARQVAIEALKVGTCEDCVSREAAIATTDFADCPNVPVKICKQVTDEVVKRLKALPSVTQKQRMGHWIELTHYHCSNCYEDTGFTSDCAWQFCPNCGAKMFEPQESEDNYEN